MSYPDHLVAWLVDVCNATEWRLKPLEVIATEEQYPGLLDDMMTDLWQRGIIKQQLQGRE